MIYFIIGNEEGYISTYREYYVSKADATKFDSIEQLTDYMKENSVMYDHTGTYTIETKYEVLT